jgi:threonine synthase
LIERCYHCGQVAPRGFHPFCDHCGGMIDVEYPIDGVILPTSDDPYERFAPLLPVADPRHLPVSSYTPLVHAERLGRALGLGRLYLKDETLLPTGTTKDRMAAVALAYLYERGVRAFCASSTGNSSTGFGRAIRAFPDMQLYLFTAEQFVPRVQHSGHGQVTHFGLRGASFVEAAAAAADYAKQHGLASESGFFNPGRREGLKLALLEALEQAPEPVDWYVQAVSSAMGVYGAFKGAKELLALGRIKCLPRLLCVQQASCAPMANAWAEGSEIIRPEHRVAMPQGIAEAILRGDPTRAYPYIRQIVTESGGDILAVDEIEIRDARRLVEDLEGISPCFSAAAAVAGARELARRDEAAGRSLVVVNLTGSDRPVEREARSVVWLDRVDGRWEAPAPAVSGGVQA